MKRLFSAAVLGCLTALMLTGMGCTGKPKTTGSGSNGAAEQVKKLNIGGATFIYPMMDKWSYDYEKVKGTKVNYNSIGSGSGIQQMMAGTLDFGCSDAPLNDKQLAEAKEKKGEVVHIPLAMGAVVPAYNLAGVDVPIKFTGPILADIYLGKITKWNDPALASINPGVNLPDKQIAVASRSDGSGTTYIWVDYLAKISSEWKEKVGVGTSVKFPTGVGAKGNEGVAGFVSKNDGAIGYIELIYALGNNIKFGTVQNKEGNFVTASLASVTAAAAGALTEIPDELRYSLTNAPGKDAYPISGTNWAILYVKQPENKKQAIVDFLYWITHDGQELCAAKHYARLPSGLVERLEKKLAQVKAAN